MGKYAKTALLIFGFVFAYYFYRGVTTIAWEGDSLAYHIPLAQNIVAGNFSRFTSWGEWYPGASEIILAIFMVFGIPLNLYNLLAWLLLIFLCFKLSRHFGLSPSLAMILAVSVGLINSVTRLIPTQTIDIWLAVYYLWAILLLEKPQKTSKYFFLLGTALGMIIGSKYSGPLFVMPLIVIYYKRVLEVLSLKSLSALLPIAALGVSWYVRNWLLTGDPLYPAHAPDFKLLNWQLWKTGLLLPRGGLKIIEALISEYLIWAIAPLVALKVKNTKLKFLGFANLAICLFLPTWPENLISDLRYTFIAFIPLIITAFLWFQKRQQGEKIALLGLVAIISVMPQLDYFPKLFFAFAAMVFMARGAPSRN